MQPASGSLDGSSDRGSRFGSGSRGQEICWVHTSSEESSRELPRGAPTVCRAVGMGRKDQKPRVDGRVISGGKCCSVRGLEVSPQLCQELLILVGLFYHCSLISLSIGWGLEMMFLV